MERTDLKEEMIEAVSNTNPCEQQELFRQVDGAGKNSTAFRMTLWELVEDRVLEFTETYGVRKGPNFKGP